MIAERPGLLFAVALSTALGAAGVEGQLGKSLEAKPQEWIDATDCHGRVITIADEPTIVIPAGDPTVRYWRDFANARSRFVPATYRVDVPISDQLRGRLEAYEAGLSYDEVEATSPTGVAFVKPARAR